MFNWIKRLFEKEPQVSRINRIAPNALRQAPEAQFAVSFDERKIKLTVPDGRTFTVAWHNLVGVAIQTTDEGPFQPDVFWLLGTKDGSLRVPQGAQGEDEFLHRLQQLPDFNNEALISAMGSANNNVFICWQRNEKE